MTNWLKTTFFSTVVSLLFNETFRRDVKKWYAAAKSGLTVAFYWVASAVYIRYMRIFRPKAWAEMMGVFVLIALFVVVADALTKVSKQPTTAA